MFALCKIRISFELKLGVGLADIARHTHGYRIPAERLGEERNERARDAAGITASRMKGKRAKL